MDFNKERPPPNPLLKEGGLRNMIRLLTLFLLLSMTFAYADKDAEWPGSVQVKRHGNEVITSVWGRNYAFENGPFPKGITSKGKAVLQSPIRLICVIDGKQLIWKASLLKSVSSSSDKVVFVIRAADKNSGIILDSQVCVECNGLVKTDFTLSSAKPCRIDSLIVEIPFAKGLAKYNSFGKTGDKWSVDFGQAMSSYPNIYLCDEERGLAVFSESDKNWKLNDPGKAIEFFFRNGSGVLRLNLINDPLDVNSDKLQYSIGMMATPVKPITLDYFAQRVTIPPDYGRDYEILTKPINEKPALDYYAKMGVKTLMLSNWTDILCYNKPVGHESDLHNLVKECHKRGIRVIVYFGYQISAKAPEFEKVIDKIKVVPQETNPDHYGNDEYQLMYRVCLNSVWQDWLIDGVSKLIDDYDIDGVYLDTTACVRSEGCANVSHGCGYKRADSSIAPTYPLFVTRNAMMKLYKLVKSKKPDGIVEMHNYQFPAVAWSTGVWNGEGLASIPRGKFAMDVLPLSKFKAVYVGKSVGVPAEFLCYGQPFVFEEAYAFCILHDIPIRALGGSWLEFNSKLWKVFDDFGRKDSKWFPYWNNESLVQVKPKPEANGIGVYVSLYKHPKNGVLAVVSNLIRDTQDAGISLETKKLNILADQNALDTLSGEKIPVKNGIINLNMKSMEWKLIWINPR